MLYPYRASARKNQLRWQFGVLVPPRQAELDASERSSVRTECIVDPGATPAPARAPALPAGPAPHASRQRSPRRLRPGRRRSTSTARRGSRGTRPSSTSWTIAELDLLPTADARREVPVHLPAGATSRSSAPTAGELVGRAVRTRAGGRRSWCASRRTLGRRPGRLPVSPSASRTSPTGAIAGATTRDDVAARDSLVAVHTLLAVDDGTFVSLLEPPDAAAAGRRRVPQRRHVPRARRSAAATSCCRLRSSSTTSRRSPRRAPATSSTPPRSTRSSRLRVLTLTDEEKAEARGHRRPGRRDRRPLRRPPAGGVGATARRGPLDHAGRRDAPSRSRRRGGTPTPRRRSTRGPSHGRSPASRSPPARRSCSDPVIGGPTPTTSSSPG